MKEILLRCRSARKLRHPDNNNGTSCHQLEDDDDDDVEEERGLSRRSKGKKQCGGSVLLLRSSGYVDPGWEHGVAQDERKKKVKCNYCGKIVSGGINRFKQHLARIPGEVAPCKAAPEEVYAKIKENMKWHRAGKRQNVPDDGALTVSQDPEQDDEEEEEHDFYGRYSKDKRRRSFVSEARRPKRVKGSSFTSPSSSRQIRTSSYTACSRREVTSSISKFFHHVGVPTEAANSLYFRNMVQLIGMYGEGWILSAAAKSEEGREVEKTVSSAAFWKKVQYVLKSVDPVMQVIRMVGHAGERLSLPYAYGYMCRAKMAIKSVHGDDARKYGPFWRVIDYHWNSLFHHPLYVAAYFFNPAYRYRSDFMAHSEVVRGVNECIVRLEPDNARRITALMQIPEYTSAKGDFGTELAIGTRTELDPAAWWQQHGISCLELQRVAVRILSHTCCSVGCEPKWSVYDQVNGESQSRFVRKSRRDAAYVHYNLRLREKQLKRRMHDDDDDDDGPPPISLNYVLLDRLLPDWLVTSEKEEEENLQDEDRDVEEENCYDHYGDGEENVDLTSPFPCRCWNALCFVHQRFFLDVVKLFFFRVRRLSGGEFRFDLCRNLNISGDMASNLPMSPELEQIHGEIRDHFRALANGFQRLDKIKDSTRQSKQLEELTDKMRDCKRLVKDFDRELKDEEARNPPEVNKQLNDEKQSMIKELNSYVALRKTYMSTLGNKKVELFDMGAGASGEPPTTEENVQVASAMSNQELVDAGMKRMDETDQAIERSKQVVEQTIEVGTQTAANLKGQTDQMGRVVNQLDTIQFSLKKASKLVKEIGRQVATDKCIMMFLFLIVCGVVAIIVVKIVHPNNKDIRDIPGLAPPAPSRKLLYLRNPEYMRR
ncbi:Target SNARE coiled-coil homology domain protein [Raphanus sativus]|nr:Target SNARE coiled-coil homology domain protein [Raphanus sativus]